MKYTTNYTQEDYNLVIKLRKKGLGIKRIYQQLNNKGKIIKEGAIGGWIYNHKKPFETLLTKIPESSRDLTITKSYLLGVLCGDGYLTTNYRIGLNVCDLDFIKEFKRCIKEIYNINCKINIRDEIVTNYGKGKRQYSILFGSKNAWLDLIRYTSFKTKEWEVPKEISENSNLEIKAAFIRGIFDSEGTIRLRRNGWAYLQVCSGNNNSLLEIKNLLSKHFGVEMKVKFNPNKVMVLYCQKYKDIKNYADNIHFIIKRKKERLDFCLSTYKRKNLRKYEECLN